MVYLSHPVRRMREEPSGDVRLVVEVDPAAIDRESLRAAIAEADGELLDSLPYDTYLVRLPQAEIDAFSETDGLVSIETTNAIGHGDAGESVEHRRSDDV